MAVSVDELTLPDELPELPSDWNYRQLGDLVVEKGICYGIVQPGSHNSDGVPIVRVNNIRNGRIDTTDVMRVESAIEEKYRRSRLNGDEVLLTLVGTLGETAIVPPELRGWNVARAVGVIPVRSDPGSRWVSICLGSAFVQHCIRIWATTTVQATFNLRDVAKLPIPIPPHATREAISSILGTLDDKIELNRRMNATLEAMARALFQSWFVDFDPVRAKLDGRQPAGLDAATAGLFPERFQDSALGPIPQGWDVKTVGEIGNVVCGKTPSTAISAYYGDDIPFITIPDMHGNIFGASTARKLSHAGANSQGKKTLPPGSICVSCIATPGLVVITSENSQTNQQINSVVPLQSDETYFWYWVLTGLGAEIASSGSGGSVLTNLSKGRFETLKVIRPPFENVRLYHNAVRPLFETILAHAHQSHTLAALRDALLPKLLSGELRVGNGERIVGRAT